MLGGDTLQSWLGNMINIEISKTDLYTEDKSKTGSNVNGSELVGILHIEVLKYLFNFKS